MLKTCPECSKEISSEVKKCPHCGKDFRNWFMRHKILTFIGGFILLIILASAASGGGNKQATVSQSSNQSSNQGGNQSSNQSNNQSSPANTDVTAKIGDTIKTDKFEIVVTKAENRDTVGNDFFEKKPSSGGMYIAAQWQYKNISDKPVGSFSTPKLKLVDKNNTKYDPDIDATSSFATELKIDRKIFSDLNPGIMVKDAEVFEVSKELYQKGGWRLYVSSDKDAYVPLN